MSTDSNTDKVKGRAKEAAGAITDDEELKREGKADQQSGKVKSKVEDASDTVKDAVDDVKNRVSGS